MKKCVIFCAGGFDRLAAPIGTEDVVIAADGGLAHTDRLGIRPNIVLGDFDSLGYFPENAQVFPVEKDDTDCMLAIRQGLRLGCREFWIYGGLDGPRLEHTVANFQALHYLCDHGARGYLIGNSQIACGIQREKMEFPAAFSGYFSAFCLGKDAGGVTIRGMKYETENVMLTANFPLGVSNQFLGKAAEISVESGTLLLIWDRENGLPMG